MEQQREKSSFVDGEVTDTSAQNDTQQRQLYDKCLMQTTEEYLSTLLNQYLDATAKVKVYAEYIKSLQNELTTRDKRLAEVKTDKSGSDTNIQDLQQQIKNTQNSQKAEQDRAAKLQGKLNETYKTNDSLQNTIQALKRQLQQYEAKKDNNDEQVNRIKRELQAETRARGALEQRLNEALAELRSYKQVVQEHEKAPKKKAAKKKTVKKKTVNTD